MAENMNMKLNDEDLVQASGGLTFDEHGMPEFDALGTVVRCCGDQVYLVCLDDGAEISATFDERHMVADGTKVGVTAVGGGWEMKELDLDY